MKPLELPKHFSHCKSVVIFPDVQCSKAGISTACDPIWSEFELILEVMVVLVTCKYKEDPMKMSALEWPQPYMSIFQTLKGRQFRSQW